MRSLTRAAAAVLLLTLGLSASPALAESGQWERLWGGGVVQGGGTGFNVCTVAASCQAASNPDLSATPSGVGVDPRNGDVWVTDGARVEKYAADGSFLLAVGKNVQAGGGDLCTVLAQCTPGENGGLGVEFAEPAGLSVDADGDLWVADGNNNRIQELSASGSFIRAFGFGVTGSPGFAVCTVASSCTSGSDSDAAGGAVSHAISVANGSDGSVYLVDHLLRVTRFATSSTPADVQFVSAWGRNVVAGNAVTGYEVCTVSSQCQLAQTGVLGGDLSLGVAVAVSGNQVFVVDGPANARIEVYGTDGSWQRAWGKDVVAGNAETGFEVCTVAALCKDGGAGTSGGELDKLMGLDSIAVGPAGDVYFADTGNNRVQVFSTAGVFRRAFGKDVVIGGQSGYEVCTVATSCQAGVIGGLGGEFSDPVAVETGPDRAVVVTDSLNGRVQEFRDSSAGTAVFAFSATSYSHAESGAVTVTVNRTGDVQAPVHVGYATGGGTATPGVDYTATSGTLQFGAGETTKTFDVAITADTVDEPDETVQLTLSSPGGGGQLGTPSTATLTIVDDDDVSVPPTLDTIIDSGPTGETYVSTPSFGFHSTVGGSTFQCRLDGAAYAACTVPFVAPVLATGPHSFDVRAVGPDAQLDATPAHADFSIGAEQTVIGDCSLTAVPVSGSKKPNTCRIGGHLQSKCKGVYFCVHKDMDCPPGSRCTMTTTATWRDNDPEVSWSVLARARHFADTDDHRRDETCRPSSGSHRCTVTAVDAGLVPQGTPPATDDWANAYCVATATGARRQGSPEDRRLDCHGVLQYEPTQAVQPLAAGNTVQLLAPGAGTITLSSKSAGKVAARGKQPTFATTTQSVSGSGVVTFKPKLAKKLKKKLKAGKKVKLTVHSTYRSPGGTVVSSSAKVVLTKVEKVKGVPSGRTLSPRPLPPLF